MHATISYRNSHGKGRRRYGEFRSAFDSTGILPPAASLRKNIVAATACPFFGKRSASTKVGG